ncbi:MAG: YceI family protein [Acidimicrobiia bacterium]
MVSTMHDLTRTEDGSVVPAPGTWVIDGSHSSAEFVARHLMVTKVRGGFKDISGTIVVGDAPVDSSVDVTIQTSSVTTGDAERDGHVTSPDFFDIENYPVMTFVSTAVRRSGSAWQLEGELTIKDVTKPVVLDFDFEGVINDPWGNAKAAFSGKTEIDREEWGLTWNVALDAGGVLVSKKVAIEIEVQASPAP